MSRVLYIEASPRGEQSFSSRVAAAFFEAYRVKNPDDTIDHLRLFEDPIPDFDSEAARQKMQHIADLVAGGKGIGAVGKWAGVVREIDRLKAADKVVLSSPMWNYSIPYRLKQYIDVIVQPALTFYVSRSGEYRGLIRGKPMQLILASGSEYALRFPEAGDGTKTDFQCAYLEHIARFIGFEDIRLIRIQPTEAAPRAAIDQMLESRLDAARHAAQAF